MDQGSGWQAFIQAKRYLCAGEPLKEAVAQWVTAAESGLDPANNRLVIAAGKLSGPMRALKQVLNRGRTDHPGAPTHGEAKVLADVRHLLIGLNDSERDLVLKCAVIWELQVEEPDEPGSQLAVSHLRQVVVDGGHDPARTAWESLRRISGQAARLRGGYNLEGWRAALCGDGIELCSTAGSGAASERRARDPRLYHSNRSAAKPRQLLAAPAMFAGRASALDALTKQLDSSRRAGKTIAISALHGMGGIGKTWLALHWAHQHISEFPDGQLFVNLRGFDPTGDPLDPSTFVRNFLLALGLTSSEIPADPDAQNALYRSLVADKQLLILLDNARDSSQVSPLLPGSPSCTVLVTSRNSLSGLTTSIGIKPVMLDVMDLDDALELLRQRIGYERVTADQDAANDLVELCGGIPLALSIVAARVARSRRTSLATAVAELRDRGTRLDELEGDDPTINVRSVLSWSINQLGTEQANSFLILGLIPGPDASLAAISSLLAVSRVKAKSIARLLEGESLLVEHEAGRYAMHDIVKLYTNERATKDLPDSDQKDAVRRLIDYYIGSAHAANSVLFPHHPSVDILPAAEGVIPHAFPDQTMAWEWLDAEHLCIRAAGKLAARSSLCTETWRLAWALDTFYRRRGSTVDSLAMWPDGLTAAEQLGDVSMQAWAHRGLGQAYAQANQQEEAIYHLRQAAELAKKSGDTKSQVNMLRALAHTYTRFRMYAKALSYAKSAIELSRSVHDELGEARALNNAGWASAHLGEYEGADEYAREAMKIISKDTDSSYLESKAFILDTIGYIAHNMERYPEARDSYLRSIEIAQHLGYAYNLAGTLDRLGSTYKALGDIAKAKETWQQALDSYEAQFRTAEADRIRKEIALME